MRLKLMCKRLTALMLAVLMVLSMFPSAVYAEEMASDVATATDVAVDPVDVADQASASEQEINESTMPEDVADEAPPTESPPDDSTEDSDELPENEVPTVESPSNEEEPDSVTDEVIPGAESELQDEQPDTEEVNTEPVDLSLKESIQINGFCYVQNTVETNVYNNPELTEDGHIFVLNEADSILLAVAYTELDTVHIWFMLGDGVAMHGYVDAAKLADKPLSDEALATMVASVSCCEFSTDAGKKVLYLTSGIMMMVDEPVEPSEDLDNTPVADAAGSTTLNPDTETEAEEDTPNDGMSDGIPVDGEQTENEDAAADAPQKPTDGDASSEVSEQQPAEGEAQGSEEISDVDQEMSDEQLIEDSLINTPSVEEELPEAAPFAEGEYVHVTTETRVFTEVDNTLTDDYFGDFYFGVFTKEAVVKIEEVISDEQGRYWLKVTFLYGDTFTNGKLKWTATDTIYTLGEDVAPADSTELTVTDCAYPVGFPIMRLMSRSTTAMNGFSLKSISGSIGSFSVGDTAYGSSGRDRDYPQIATLEGHGKIYATPHYLEGYTVYCLEHTLPGPGENISGGGKQPSGPYTIVDWDGYMSTAGYSGARAVQPRT